MLRLHCDSENVQLTIHQRFSRLGVWVRFPVSIIVLVFVHALVVLPGLFKLPLPSLIKFLGTLFSGIDGFTGVLCSMSMEIPLVGVGKVDCGESVGSLISIFFDMSNSGGFFGRGRYRRL
ncbi:hypothetical protein AG1IA_09507 [Rhizoctonia solani AG-1 IA]|uniref:Uncharacterized protein n=1 Tax=Thanatephorus cucumeris (strain AG1-IA) TaxID=983506 RepID=L8WIB3_THACA|nr:hypothetical protein AG1IA_09507 [Rhizoctonia solani AG-1 IA]